MTKNNHYGILDVSITSPLSFAVELVDNYTNQKPLGTTNIIMMDEPDSKPVLNKSGYWLFLKPNNTNPNHNNKTIKVISSYYFDVVQQVNFDSFDDPKYPVVSIQLIPRPSYPFPSNLTMLRGMIRDVNKKPIEDAVIAVSDTDIRTRSTEKGEFVLYFIDSLKEFISKENFINHNIIRITLKISHPNFKDKIASIEIQNRKTTSLTIILEEI